MINTDRSIQDRYLGFLLFSVFAVTLALVIAVVLYRSKFGGGLSITSGEWSNFGGYIGGIFGPLVSFVTLLAVLKTVYMQRELLEVQKAEFKSMNVLQQQTFDTQLNQMTKAASDARVLQVSAAQDTAIKVVDQHISIYERVWDRQNESAYRFDRDEGHRSSLPGDEAFFDSILRHRDEARFAIDQLARLSVELAVTEFRNVHDVRKSLALGLDRIRTSILSGHNDESDKRPEVG
ncbi:hypothetical protein [Pseudomonas yamanorum]|uniref:hypothetical protein n=1 Tax=Pseudomonas yamanorum TaxID=515393 RepID=UPI0008798D69|nr:hypothetical protein [Pseudomonas yamanorum]SDT98113.1 hypothetical protein SAMN05216237_1031 [Pseudomonas yamanorum]